MILNNLVPLKSSYLHSAGYDAAGNRLAIRFRSGLVRWYSQPVQVFQRLMAATSPGTFFNQVIRHTNFVPLNENRVAVAVTTSATRHFSKSTARLFPEQGRVENLEGDIQNEHTT